MLIENFKVLSVSLSHTQTTTLLCGRYLTYLPGKITNFLQTLFKMEDSWSYSQFCFTLEDESIAW